MGCDILTSLIGLASDGSGGFVFCDSASSSGVNVVRRVTAAGQISTLAGTSLPPLGASANGVAASSARFQKPFDVSGDQTFIYIVGELWTGHYVTGFLE